MGDDDETQYESLGGETTELGELLVDGEGPNEETPPNVKTIWGNYVSSHYAYPSNMAN